MRLRTNENEWKFTSWDRYRQMFVDEALLGTQFRLVYNKIINQPLHMRNERTGKEVWCTAFKNLCMVSNRTHRFIYADEAHDILKSLWDADWKENK